MEPNEIRWGFFAMLLFSGIIGFVIGAMWAGRPR